MIQVLFLFGLFLWPKAGLASGCDGLSTLATGSQKTKGLLERRLEEKKISFFSGEKLLDATTHKDLIQLLDSEKIRQWERAEDATLNPFDFLVADGLMSQILKKRVVKAKRMSLRTGEYDTSVLNDGEGRSYDYLVYEITHPPKKGEEKGSKTWISLYVYTRPLGVESWGQGTTFDFHVYSVDDLDDLESGVKHEIRLELPHTEEGIGKLLKNRELIEELSQVSETRRKVFASDFERFQRFINVLRPVELTVLE